MIYLEIDEGFIIGYRDETLKKISEVNFYYYSLIDSSNTY